MAKKRSFVDIEAAGNREHYAKVLRKIQKDKVCPFCPEHFKYHTRPILLDGEHWLLTENMAPYTGTKHHFLLLHKKHVEHVQDVTPEAWAELLSQIKWASDTYKLPAGGLFMRFGDKRYTGASVTQHLHAQLIMGTVRTKKTYPISAHLGYSTIKYEPKKPSTASPARSRRRQP